MVKLNLFNLKTPVYNHSNYVFYGKKAKYSTGYFPYSNLNLGGKGMNALSNIFDFIGKCIGFFQKLK